MRFVQISFIACSALFSFACGTSSTSEKSDDNRRPENSLLLPTHGVGRTGENTRTSSNTTQGTGTAGNTNLPDTRVSQKPQQESDAKQDSAPVTTSGLTHEEPVVVSPQPSEPAETSPWNDRVTELKLFSPMDGGRGLYTWDLVNGTLEFKMPDGSIRHSKKLSDGEKEVLLGTMRHFNYISADEYKAEGEAVCFSSPRGETEFIFKEGSAERVVQTYDKDCDGKLDFIYKYKVAGLIYTFEFILNPYPQQ